MAVTGGRDGQRGSITAETAVAFPALVLVLVVALWGVSAAAAQVACVDAARAGARAAARGEPETEVRTAIRQAAPANAHITVTRDPATTTVVVTASTRPPLKALFPTLRIQAQAVTATEPEGSDATTERSSTPKPLDLAAGPGDPSLAAQIRTETQDGGW